MSTEVFPMTRRKPVRQTKYLIGVGLIIATIIGLLGWLIYSGLTGTQQYYWTVGELFAKGQAAVGEGVRVGGNLVPDSIQQDVPHNKINFALTDGSRQLLVSYNGVVPDTFPKASQVIAEGKLGSDGTFVASTVLAKCPSKYDAANVQPSDYQWYTTSSGGNLNYGK